MKQDKQIMLDNIQQALRNAVQMAYDAGAEYVNDEPGNEPLNGLAELADQLDSALEDVAELRSQLIEEASGE